jgi:hypothetical protein
MKRMIPKSPFSHFHFLLSYVQAMLFCILVVELQIHLSRNKGHLHYFPPPIHNILLLILSICFLAMYMLVVTIQRFILVFAVHTSMSDSP